MNKVTNSEFQPILNPLQVQERTVDLHEMEEQDILNANPDWKHKISIFKEIDANFTEIKNSEEKLYDYLKKLDLINQYRNRLLKHGILSTINLGDRDLLNHERICIIHEKIAELSHRWIDFAGKTRTIKFFFSGKTTICGFDIMSETNKKMRKAYRDLQKYYHHYPSNLRFLINEYLLNKDYTLPEEVGPSSFEDLKASNDIINKSNQRIYTLNEAIKINVTQDPINFSELSDLLNELPTDAIGDGYLNFLFSHYPHFYINRSSLSRLMADFLPSKGIFPLRERLYQIKNVWFLEKIMKKAKEFNREDILISLLGHFVNNHNAELISLACRCGAVVRKDQLNYISTLLSEYKSKDSQTDYMSPLTYNFEGIKRNYLLSKIHAILLDNYNKQNERRHSSLSFSSSVSSATQQSSIQLPQHLWEFDDEVKEKESKAATDTSFEDYFNYANTILNKDQTGLKQRSNRANHKQRNDRVEHKQSNDHVEHKQRNDHSDPLYQALRRNSMEECYYLLEEVKLIPSVQVLLLLIEKRNIPLLTKCAELGIQFNEKCWQIALETNSSEIIEIVCKEPESKKRVLENKENADNEEMLTHANFNDSDTEDAQESSDKENSDKENSDKKQSSDKKERKIDGEIPDESLEEDGWGDFNELNPTEVPAEDGEEE